jgi:hypothetical protein
LRQTDRADRDAAEEHGLRLGDPATRTMAPGQMLRLDDGDQALGR